jgi:hypothetical protein
MRGDVGGARCPPFGVNAPPPGLVQAIVEVHAVNNNAGIANARVRLPDCVPSKRQWF